MSVSLKTHYLIGVLLGSFLGISLSVNAETAPPVLPNSGGGTRGVQQMDNYRLTAQDVVQIKVFQETDLETTARISKDGTIPFPLIGSVSLGGRTVQEAGNTIREKLKEYLVNPQITLKITEYSKRRFTVLGQVGRPGTYDFPDDTTMNLLEAIGMAGGYTRIANPGSIILKRQVNGQEVIYKLNAKSMSKDEATKRFEIQPGDTILVGESII